ncbi:MAG: helix-turn-helix domain-containing protein [Planctomycetota bacterium]|nr:helix-turn-helix domain-containing protein [Planctomycetota bacterium]
MRTDPVRLIRVSLHLTIPEVAELAGVTGRTIQNVETGAHDPRRSVYERIRAALRRAYLDRGPVRPLEMDDFVRRFLGLPPRGPGRPPKGPGRDRRRRLPSDGAGGAAPAAAEGDCANGGNPVGAEATRAGTASGGDATAPVGIDAAANPAPVGIAAAAANPAPAPWPPPGLHDPARLADAWRALAADYSRARRRALLDAIREACPWAATLSDGAICARMVRLHGVRPGRRSRCGGRPTAERDRAWAAILGAALAAHRKEAVSKGAYDDRAPGSRRKQLVALLALPEMRERLQAEAGAVPTIHQAERVLRRYVGRVAPRAECRAYIDGCLGTRARYAGQVMYTDGTGPQVRVLRRWGIRSSKGVLKPQWYVLADQASGRISIHPSMAAGEAALDPAGQSAWSAALWEWLFSLGFAPEVLVMDAISGLAGDLARLEPGRPPALTKGVLLWLAAGALPYVHQPARPTGGAHVERAIREAKDAWAAKLIADAVAAELAGAGPTRAREFGSFTEFVRATRELEESLNAMAYRGAESRAALWERGAAERASRALAPDARARADAILAAARVTVHQAGRLRCRVGEKVVAADVMPETLRLSPRAPAGHRLPEDAPALTFPGGLLASDPPDLVRAVIVEVHDGQPLFHAAAARVASLDEYYQDTRLPYFGEGFRARPRSVEDEKAAMRDRMAEAWRERVAALAATGTENVRGRGLMEGIVAE